MVSVDDHKYHLAKTAMVISLDEIVNVILKEQITYPLVAFMSDTGGVAGLFLGLNIIGF